MLVGGRTVSSDEDDSGPDDDGPDNVSADSLEGDKVAGTAAVTGGTVRAAVAAAPSDFHGDSRESEEEEELLSEDIFFLFCWSLSQLIFLIYCEVGQRGNFRGGIEWLPRHVISHVTAGLALLRRFYHAQMNRSASHLQKATYLIRASRYIPGTFK